MDCSFYIYVSVWKIYRIQKKRKRKKNSEDRRRHTKQRCFIVMNVNCLNGERSEWMSEWMCISCFVRCNVREYFSALTKSIRWWITCLFSISIYIYIPEYISEHEMLILFSTFPSYSSCVVVSGSYSFLMSFWNMVNSYLFFSPFVRTFFGRYIFY